MYLVITTIIEIMKYLKILFINIYHNQYPKAFYPYIKEFFKTKEIKNAIKFMRLSKAQRPRETITTTKTFVSITF